MDDAAAARRAARNTIGDAIGRAADRYRDRIALRFGGRAWSYAALHTETTRLAAALPGWPAATGWWRSGATPTATCCAGLPAARPG